MSVDANDWELFHRLADEVCARQAAFQATERAADEAIAANQVTYHDLTSAYGAWKAMCRLMTDDACHDGKRTKRDHATGLAREVLGEHELVLEYVQQDQTTASDGPRAAAAL